MLVSSATTKIWLYTGVADMRKSFAGLAALVKSQLGDNPLSGDLFIFLNRRRTMMKIIYFDRSGYCIWMKRLEQGTFEIPKTASNKVGIDQAQLTMILDGIDLSSIRHRKRFRYAA